MAGADVRGVRVAAAVTGVLAVLPLSVVLAKGAAESTARTADLVVFVVLLLLGPAPVAVTSLRVALGGKWAGGFHLATLAVSALLAFFAAGFAAMGGGHGVGWLLLGFLFFGLSVVTTIVSMVLGRVR